MSDELETHIYVDVYVTVKARGCLSRLYDHGLNCDAARESGQDADRGNVRWVDLEAVNQAASNHQGEAVEIRRVTQAGCRYDGEKHDNS